MSTTLVTGVTGQVGTGFLPRLLAQRRPGEQIRVLVRDPSRADRLADLGAEPVLGDLRDTDALGKALAGADAVVNIAAAFRGVPDEEATAVNRDAALELGRAALASGARRFVQVSTVLVYGTGRGRPHVEDDPCVPGGPMWTAYPQAKAEAERGLAALDGLDLRIGRLGYVYGEGDPHLAAAVRWTEGWPAAKRFFHLVHTADVAQGLLRLLYAPGADGRAYNIADDAPVTTLELRQLLGADLPGDGVDPDPWYCLVSTDRIRRELGYRPQYPTLWSARDAGAL
ncbi:NAD-dependent epimerase/dehydratase family protein [Streptomyces diastatochromogenes]|uniref:Epimerase n=1 Tax=Streptomyces diastatochromogenes TaxID=42236 RepID=A0A233S2C6_STRDA|nr:NAD(P)-dependent oxidoreductase [Streptomyces diastatochromogenes]OXY89785.1 epimerase [Streptomyces diastatochromogenes]